MSKECLPFVNMSSSVLEVIKVMTYGNCGLAILKSPTDIE